MFVNSRMVIKIGDYLYSVYGNESEYRVIICNSMDER